MVHLSVSTLSWVLLFWIQCWCVMESSAVACGTGFWGTYCQHQCMCRNQGEQCDVVTGKCVSGCKPGWTGEACDVFRCWYGDPVISQSSAMCHDSSSNSSCPADYMCVKRHYYMSGQSTWQGCCPVGDGPCHTATQQITPMDAATDLIPPSCDRFGNYEAKQCSAMGPCSCMLPNGTYIPGTTHWTFTNTTNCTKAVNNYLRDKVCNVTGRWGVNCSHKCMCNDPSEQCDRITGQCRNGCIPGFTGKACQEIFKCWFGQPVTRQNDKTCSYMDGDDGMSQNLCPTAHVCVVRRFDNRSTNTMGAWYGCCPEGRGPCDRKRQEIAPIDGEGDMIPPNCDPQGNYQPKQCQVFGCSCVLPNGTHIPDTFKDWKDSFDMNCADVVKKHLSGNVKPCPAVTETYTRKWGPKCEYDCACDVLHEQCDKETGTCEQSGCRRDRTGPGCQERVKCWFGKAIESPFCNDDIENRDSYCPQDHICVDREYYMDNYENPWQGCCPKGKGPCETEKQRIGPMSHISDLPIPECYENGNYKPKQCAMGGCSCYLPNGTYFQGSSTGWDENANSMDCESVVNKYLAGKCAGEACLSSLLSSPKKKTALVAGLCAFGVVVLIAIAGFAVHQICLQKRKAAAYEKEKPNVFVQPVITVQDTKEKNVI